VYCSKPGLGLAATSMRPWRDWYTRRFQNSDWKEDCGMAADPSLAQLAPSGSYRALTVVLRVFATFAVITGLS